MTQSDWENGLGINVCNVVLVIEMDSPTRHYLIPPQVL